MLKRIITAVVAVALFIPVLYFSDTYVFPAAMAFLATIASFEMLKCLGTLQNWAFSIPQVIISAALPILMRLGSDDPTYIRAAIFIHFVYAIYLMAYAVMSKGAVKLEMVAETFFTCLYVNTGFSSLVLLRDAPQGKYIFILAFLGPWISDSFAYFFGRAFGRHKLIPEVSPKKTVEGCVAGILFCALSYMVYALLLGKFGYAELNVVALTVFGLVVSVVSQVGDLSASFIKREYGIKDYGNLFPGHGGVLDRFDSVLPVATILMILIYSYDIVKVAA